MKMDLSKKLAVALLLVPFVFIVAFVVSVLGAYGSFSNISHYDVAMWTFWAVVGLLIALVYAVILIFVVTLQDESVGIEEDGSYLESFDFEPVEAPEPVIEEEIVEEEVVEELEVEVPEELQTLNIDDLEPEEQAKRKAAEERDQAPQSWKEEKFE